LMRAIPNGMRFLAAEHISFLVAYGREATFLRTQIRSAGGVRVALAASSCGTAERGGSPILRSSVSSSRAAGRPIAARYRAIYPILDAGDSPSALQQPHGPKQSAWAMNLDVRSAGPKPLRRSPPPAGATEQEIQSIRSPGRSTRPLASRPGAARMRPISATLTDGVAWQVRSGLHIALERGDR